MKRDVITFGSATLDIFCETERDEGRELLIDGEQEPVLVYRLGDKELIRELHMEIGGGGTNTAAALKRLDLSVAFGGCVGEDKPGRDVQEWLSEQGIAFVGHTVAEQTNLSVILDSKRLKDRTILVYKCASDLLDRSLLDDGQLEATWMYFSSLLGKSFDSMLSLMRYQRAKGGAIAFNPSAYQTAQGLDALREAITLSQLLILNREEAGMLVGDASSAELCHRLRREGAEIVLVTDGGDGATLLYGDTLYASPSEATDVVETTGAGDCFAATFLGGLVLGLEPEQALRLAHINTESLISEVGAKNGLLDKDKLLSCLGKDSRPIRQEKI